MNEKVRDVLNACSPGGSCPLCNPPPPRCYQCGASLPQDRRNEDHCETCAECEPLPMNKPTHKPEPDAPAVKTFSTNNDFDPVGMPLDEAISEARFDLATWHEGFLLLRADLTKEQALAAVENLRWLVEKSFEPTRSPTA